MALASHEIAVGVVAYFDVKALNADPRVQLPRNPTPRNGPFVCVAVKGDRSTWTPLTYSERDERLEIADEWRIDGTDAWHKKTPYLNDGAVTYTADNNAIVDAAATADTYRPETRQRVSPEGIEAVLKEIASRGGSVLK